MEDPIFMLFFFWRAFGGGRFWAHMSPATFLILVTFVERPVIC